MKYLLDTNIISEFISKTPNKNVINHILTLDENDLLNRFQNKIIDIDTNIMLQWGLINNRLKNLGKPLPIMDSLIGATSEVYDYILITRNEKDFKNLNIKIVNPFI